MQNAILLTVQIGGLEPDLIWNLMEIDGVLLQSILALLEAYTKHSDDCYLVWDLDDTPYRLIRGWWSDFDIENYMIFLLVWRKCFIGGIHTIYEKEIVLRRIWFMEV